MGILLSSLMIKTRILMCSESSHINSGFGNYTREILSRLHSTGKYEIAELSGYRTPNTIKTEPWKIYPVGVVSTDPLYKEYTAHSYNQFGQWRFDIAAVHFKPHIVFDIRDFWNFTFEETSPLRRFYHWILAPTYDSIPQTIGTMNTFKNADLVAFHTQWAKDHLTSITTNDEINIGPVVSDSVNSEVFMKVQRSKSQHKSHLNLPPDSFIIGSVMRNQKRKLIADILYVFQKLVAKNTDKNIYLYLHTSYPEPAGWNIPALLLQHNIADRVLFTYHCNSCKAFQCKTFQKTKGHCFKCGAKNSVGLVSTSSGISQSQLNDIYNLFDVYLQYAICEGFGIPPVEAASAAIPVVTVDHGAMGEVGRNIGARLVPVARSFIELETGALRVLPDNDECEKILQEFIYMSHTQRTHISNNTRARLLENYSWDKTALIYEQIFDNIDITSKAPWDSNTHAIKPNIDLSMNLSHRDFIYRIVDEAIVEPWLKHTEFIEDMIQSLCQGFCLNGQSMMAFSRHHAVAKLDTYMQNKHGLDTLRISPEPIFMDNLSPFLNY